MDGKHRIEIIIKWKHTQTRDLSPSVLSISHTLRVRECVSAWVLEWLSMSECMSASECDRERERERERERIILSGQWIGEMGVQGQTPRAIFGLVCVYAKNAYLIIKKVGWERNCSRQEFQRLTSLIGEQCQNYSMFKNWLLNWKWP